MAVDVDPEQYRGGGIAWTPSPFRKGTVAVECRKAEQLDKGVDQPNRFSPPTQSSITSGSLGS
jgi:hypothetical protein